MTSLYCLSTEWPEIHKHKLAMLLMNLHHGAPVVAFYFQAPAHAWVNALFFGHMWWIHSRTFFYKYAKAHVAAFLAKYLDFEVEDRHCEHGYAVVTVLATALYVWRMPLGLNYSTVAVLCQFAGRFLINDNFAKVDWITSIEAPGTLAVLTWGFGPLAQALAHFALQVVLYYKTRESNKSAKVPKEVVVTEELKKWMHEFSWKKPTEAQMALKREWWEANAKDWDPKWAIFRHCMLGECGKIQDCIDNGFDPSSTLPLWYDSRPIDWCAGNGQVDALILLIENGVHPFIPSVRKAAKDFKAPEITRFLDELVPECIKAAQARSGIQHERCEKRMTFAEQEKLVHDKGGKLLTTEELEQFLANLPLYPGDDQWVATRNSEEERDWVQVGDRHHHPGKSHLKAGYGYPVWGDNMEDKTFGDITWTRVVVWKGTSVDVKADAEKPNKAAAA